jgi:hypothetical protein
LAGFVVTSRRHRRLLLSPKPYVAGLTGLLVFLPNIIWNSQNEWISYLFQLGHGGGGGYFSLEKLGKSIGGQMAVATPVFFVFLVMAWFSLARYRPLPDRDRFTLWASMPVFAFFCGIGMFGKILPHWPFVGWWAGAVAVSVLILARIDGASPNGKRWKRWAVFGAALSLVLTAFMYVAIIYPVVGHVHRALRRATISLNARHAWVPVLEPFRPKYDLSNDLYGWKEAATALEAMRTTMPNPERTFIFSHRFYTISQIGPYLSRDIAITSLRGRPSQYWLWFKAPRYAGWDAIFVNSDRCLQGGDRYRPLFENGTTEPEEIITSRHGEPVRSLHVYRYYGFKGKYEGE